MAQIICNKAYSPVEMPRNPEELVQQAIETDALDSFVLVVPTGRLVRHFKLKIIRDYFNRHKKPAVNVNVFKLDTFVRHCFAKTADRHKYMIIPDAYRLALFEEAAAHARLHFFARKDRPLTPTVLQRLASIIMGLKEDGITVEDLKQDLEQAENNFLTYIDIPRLRDIASLYESYQKLLNGKYLDYPELVYTLIKHLQPFDINDTAFDELFPNEEKLRKKKFLDNIFPIGTKVFFYGFSEFKVPEIKLISLFSKSNLPYAIHIDYSTNNGPLFGNLEDVIVRLTDEGLRLFSLEDSIDSNAEFIRKHPETMPASMFLRRWLFNTEQEVRSGKFNSVVKIIASENRIDEVRNIARLVRHLHFEKNIPLSEICIAIRQSETYPNLFREIFSQHKIPANISDRFMLARSPVSVAIFSVLDLIVKGFRREDVHRALKSSYLTFEKKNPKTRKTEVIDGSNIFDAGLKLRISGGVRRGGADRWVQRLGTAVRSFNMRLSTLKDDSASDPVEIDAAGKYLATLQRALDDFNSLLDIVNFENKHYTPAEFLYIVKHEIIGKLKIKENILKFYDTLTENMEKYQPHERVQLLEKVEKDSRAFAAFINVLDEMAFLIKDRKPDARYKLDDYVQKLRTAITAERYTTREKQNYGVTITAIEQTRGIPYKVMILCGALDGEFPLRYRPESFLGKELPDTEERFLKNERMLFYQFLTNGSDDLDAGNKQIYITYPKSDSTEELVRSPFIDALLKVTYIEESNGIIDVQEMRKDGRNNSSLKDTGFNDAGRKDTGSKVAGNKENKDSAPKNNISWLDAISCEKDVLSILGEMQYKALYYGINPPNLEKLVEISEKHNIGGTAGYVIDMVKRKYSVFDPGILELEDDTDGYASIKSLKEKPFSITELETYASCPYKYFSRNIIGLDEQSEFDLSLTPLEQGSLLHLILYRFYTQLQQQKLEDGSASVLAEPLTPGLPEVVPIRLDPKKAKQYKKQILDIAVEEINRIRFEHPFFEIEEGDFLGTNDKPGYLETWLKTELERIEEDWEFSPSLFEFNFGMNSRVKKEILSVDLDDEVKIRGKIDRIEFRKTPLGYEFLIADYKSSLSYLPVNDDVASGSAFQVPLYLLAATKIFREHYGIDAQPVGGVYYCLKPKYNKAKKKYASNQFILLPKDNDLYQKAGTKSDKYFLPDSAELARSLELSVIHAKEKINNISGGQFPVEPAEAKTCDGCSFKRICRIKEKDRFSVETSSREEGREA